EPVFSAGVPVLGWERLGDAASALSEKARGKVWIADIPKLPKGKKRFYTLYDGMNRLPRARSAAFTPSGGTTTGDGGVHWKKMIEADRRIVHFPKGALRDWPNLEDIEIFAFPHVGFTINYLPIESVDAEKGVARTTLPATYAIAPLPHFYNLPEFGDGSCVVENALDFLDRPGEWVVDTQKGKIYLWPLGEKPGDIRVPALTELLRVDGGDSGEIVRNLIFEGLTFCQGDRDVWGPDDKGLQHDWEMWDKANALVRFRNAEGCAIEKCRLTMSGATGVRLDLHCQNNTVRDNLVDHIGGTGVLLCGYGPGAKDVNKHNRVVGNHIHHTGEMFYQNLGILVWQSGENEIRNNLLHHTPYDAIVLSGVRVAFFNIAGPIREMAGTIRRDEVESAAQFWTESGDAGALNRQWMFTLPYQHTRNNLVADNEIFQVQQKLQDGNAIYLSDTGTGNVIRRNFIHHLNGSGWNQSIRADAWIKDTLITENVIHNCAGGGVNTKYYNNHVINNIISDIRDIVHPRSDGGLDRFYFGFVSMLDVWTRDKLPTRASTRIERNIFYKTSETQPFYRQAQREGNLSEIHVEDCDMDWNVYYAENEKDKGVSHLERYRGLGCDAHSIVADPGFVDAQGGDFRLKADSPALRVGFEPIDLSGVGLEDSFPERFREIVLAELGEDYRSFAKLEAICRPLDLSQATERAITGV
ncbi:right-handed parallel beta-helix repeat-containing protein, partial [bacterium]|nr:right-handed parallel beta-helix repeat-containing protein [bacterium]